MTLSRRQFLGTAAISAGFYGLNHYLNAQTPGGLFNPQPYLNEIEKYGPLIDDPRGLLDLPKGFSYRVLSRTGQPMDDGFFVPGAPDGMATFPGPDGRVIIIRNHELTPGGLTGSPFGWTNELFPKIDRKYVYDAGRSQPHLGGTTTIVYDPAAGRIERQFLSLVGTARNCAGGVTPWNSWITCEESVETAGDLNLQDHGYNFDVPASATPALTLPVPLKAMGRFNHEAVGVDPRTGIVYQTEDRSDSLIYRYIPAKPGDLAGGGRLQALALRDRPSGDTRNYPDTGAPVIRVGEWLSVRWIDLEEVDTKRDDLRYRGAAAGAAVFARGEGMWVGNGEIFFVCTDGGLAQRGQIFRYAPGAGEGTPGEEAAPGRLQLYLEPNNAQILESADNVVVAPWGDLFLCEDNAAPAPTAARQNPTNYVRGVTPQGKVYTFARNRYAGGASETAGACFAPNHPTMFLNIQNPGFTLAITGPFR